MDKIQIEQQINELPLDSRMPATIVLNSIEMSEMCRHVGDLDMARYYINNAKKAYDSLCHKMSGIHDITLVRVKAV